MGNEKLKSDLERLEFLHVFGMATLMFINSDITKITEEDVSNALEIANDITTRINWDLDQDGSERSHKIFDKAESSTLEEADKYFKEIYKHFNIV